MALTLLADATTAANPVTNFTDSFNDGLEAASGVITAVTNTSAAAGSHNTQLNSECEAKVDLAYSSLSMLAVYVNLVTKSDFTSNHYRVELSSSGPFHYLSIIRRTGGVETVLKTTKLIRGKVATGYSIGIRKYDAGSNSVIQSYADTNEGFGAVMIDEVEDTSPLQVAGYAGLWLAAGSGGMGLDNFRAGNLTVKWCATTGSDAAAGTYAAPYLTLQFACDKAQLTATAAMMVIRGGSYSQRLNDAFSDLAWKTGQDIHNWTTHQTYPGETVTLSYSGGSACVGIGQVSNGVAGTNYVQFIGYIQSGTGDLGHQTTGRNSHIRYQQVTADSNEKSGFQFAQYKIGTDPGSGDSVDRFCQMIECVSSNANVSHGVYDQISATLIEFCTISHNDPLPGGTGSAGIQHNTVGVPELGAKQTYNIIYRHNDVFDNGVGFSLSGTDDGQVYGNRIYQNRNGGGFAIGGAASGTGDSAKHHPRNVIIANNSLYGNGYGGNSNNAQMRLQINSTGCVVVNNILFGFAGDDRYNGIDLNGATGNTVANNLNGNNVDDVTSYPVANDTDPLYISTTVDAEDFHLQVTSPCRDTVSGPFSDVSSYFLYDAEGYPINGSTPDMGALQFVPEAVLLPVQRKSYFSVGFGF